MTNSKLQIELSKVEKLDDGSILSSTKLEFTDNKLAHEYDILPNISSRMERVSKSEPFNETICVEGTG
jgi:hypothetical protein